MCVCVQDFEFWEEGTPKFGVDVVGIKIDALRLIQRHSGGLEVSSKREVYSQAQFY